MIIIIVNYLCRMVECPKVPYLQPRPLHYQMLSPLQTSKTPQTGFESWQILIPGYVECSCAVAIITTP